VQIPRRLGIIRRIIHPVPPGLCPTLQLLDRRQENQLPLRPILLDILPPKDLLHGDLPPRIRHIQRPHQLLLRRERLQRVPAPPSPTRVPEPRHVHRIPKEPLAGNPHPLHHVAIKRIVMPHLAVRRRLEEGPERLQDFQRLGSPALVPIQPRIHPQHRPVVVHIRIRIGIGIAPTISTRPPKVDVRTAIQRKARHRPVTARTLPRHVDTHHLGITRKRPTRRHLVRHQQRHHPPRFLHRLHHMHIPRRLVMVKLLHHVVRNQRIKGRRGRRFVVRKRRRR